MAIHEFDTACACNFNLSPASRLRAKRKRRPEALTLARTICPDVVIIDVDKPGIDGIALTRQFKHLIPCSQVMLLSIYDDPARRSLALAAGRALFRGQRQRRDVSRRLSVKWFARHVDNDRNAAPPETGT